MEKSQRIEFTEEVSTLLDLVRRLLGHDQETVEETVTQTLLTARVNHQSELGKARNRRVHFRKNPSASLRRGTPTSGTSLVRALAQLVEQYEDRQLRDPHANPMSLWPQAYCDRYSLELLLQSLESPMAATVVATMIQHEFKEREAHAAFEIVTQHTAPQKTAGKFYEKRKKINSSAKKRFAKPNFFQSAPSGKEILTVNISETEAEANYAFLELCARLEGPPVFPTPIDKSKPIPELISNGRNFDQENVVQDLQIRAVTCPTSLQNLMKSLGYDNMEKKAKGPVLNTVISGNGNGGIHRTPLFEESEADKQAAINRVVNDYVSSVGLRRSLKNPNLEVFVDGVPIAEPFPTTSHTVHHFKLSALAKYVQVFATQCGRRVIVSNLSLPQTQISLGKAWHSELELEGQQRLSLRVEPRMDESGNLTGANLVVGYQPKIALSQQVADVVSECLTLGRQLWPAWATTGSLACAIGVLAMAPFVTIDIFSVRALVTAALLMTAFFFVVRKFKPAWQWIWPQQVTVFSYVSVMLIGMLLLGILPMGSPPGNGRTPSIEEPVQDGGSQGSRARLIGSELKYFYMHGLNGFNVELPALDAASADHPLVKEFRVRSQVSDYLARSSNVSAVRVPPDQPSVNQQKRSRGRPTDALTPTVALHDVIHVDVLVDTTQVLTLIRNSSPVSVMSESVANGAAVRAATSESNATKTEAETRPVAEPKAAAAETATSSGTNPSMVLITQETPALVVFESPTRLANLNEGDELNANIKSIALSTTDVRGETLVCTATGVVQDITRTNSDVQVRVGLVLTWQSGGNTVSRELQLLLTACSKNSDRHYGVLAAPPTDGTAVARNDTRLSKLPKPHR